MTKNAKLMVIAGLLGTGLGILAINPAAAQTLHTWTSGQVVTASDLNSNFAALKNGKVGSGVQAVNADISTSAAIAHSKLATPVLLPKAWVYVGAAACGSTPCTIAESSGVTSVARTSAGLYTITLSFTPANTSFAAIPSSGTANVHCITNGLSTTGPQITLRCYTDTTGAATDAAFSVTVMDS